MNSSPKGIFRNMLITDCFIPRIPTSKGQLQSTWNWLAGKRRQGVTREPFTLCQRKLPAAGGKEGLPVDPGSLPTGHPCQQAWGCTEVFLLYSKPACRGQIFKVKTKTLPRVFFLTPQGRKYQAGTSWCCGSSCGHSGRPPANIFPASSSTPWIIS